MNFASFISVNHIGFLGRNPAPSVPKTPLTSEQKARIQARVDALHLTDICDVMAALEREENRERSETTKA
jgi:hypothetical protein